MIRYVLLSLCLAALGGAPAKIDVYMIGDSTMADRPTPEKNPYRGWGQLFPAFFDDSVAVHNFAVNGRSTRSFIDEGRWAAVSAQLHRGDYVIIQFGHNDEKKEDSTRYTDPAGSYRRNLERFVKESRDRGAIPILCTSIVRRSFDATGILRATHGDYPRATREVAAALHVPMIDLEKATGGLVSAAGPEKSKALYGYVDAGKNEMFPEGLKDDTHLSLAGATAVAKLAALGIRASSLPLAAHVTL
ncbi:MAG: rhamnogalacturonan acetylesterase [Gemmatimonadetes bacterium]|nr:rhamnogalacturonan acetylesterase [Gemmatimonadota bacterium]